MEKYLSLSNLENYDKYISYNIRSDYDFLGMQLDFEER